MASPFPIQWDHPPTIVLCNMEHAIYFHKILNMTIHPKQIYIDRFLDSFIYSAHISQVPFSEPTDIFLVPVLDFIFYYKRQNNMQTNKYFRL